MIKPEERRFNEEKDEKHNLGKNLRMSFVYSRTM